MRTLIVLASCLLLCFLAWFSYQSHQLSHFLDTKREATTSTNRSAESKPKVKPQSTTTKSPVYGREIKGLPEFCADKLISVSGCNGQKEITTDQGNTYRLVEIGDQCWFTDNLKEVPDVKTGWYGYYDNAKEESSPGEGMLYTWDAAMNGSTEERAQGICPDGWHIPSDCELMKVELLAGINSSGLGKYGTRISNPQSFLTEIVPIGFLKMLSGSRMSVNDEFYGKGKYSAFWLSTKESSTKMYVRHFVSDKHSLSRETMFSWEALSLRCIKY